MDYIKVNIKYNIAPDGERSKVIIRKIESSTDRSSVNELPVILNLLSRPTQIPSDIDSGLPYRLSFKLA